MKPKCTDEPQSVGGVSGVCPMFVAISRFTVANGITDQVKAAFKERPHSVDSAPGFIRMDVISPVESPDEIWLLTYWSDRSCFDTWHSSHAYHEAHKGIPRGLKLVPKSTELRYFEHICT